MSNCYLPQPPRAWSRTQNSCTMFDLDTDPIIDYNKIQMKIKGNVLQYKCNSTNLTQVQRYSKIAKGEWVNRNVTWAVQNDKGYTNPNTTRLKRNGATHIAIDPITGAILGETFDPVTCPKTPIIPINDGLPAPVDSSGQEPPIPPPVSPQEGSNVFPPIIEVPIPPPIVIADGGTLICSIQEDECTGETVKHVSQQLCHLTSDSDVPGTIQELCWNDGDPTWYDKQRYMSNSTNKFPYNYKFFNSAVKPTAPIISAVWNDTIMAVVLTWSRPETTCLPISFYRIYQNNMPIANIPITDIEKNIYTYNAFVSCGTYSYYITSVTNGSNIESHPSNIEDIIVPC